MVGTIGPVVYGRAHTSMKRTAVVAAFFAGHVLAAAFLAGMLAGLGHCLQSVWSLGTATTSAVFSACCVVASAREFKLISFPLPQSTWQVPRRWMALPNNVMAFLYGLTIGMGVTIRIRFTAFYVVLIMCVVLADARVCITAILAYAVMRCLAVLIATRAFVQQTDRLRYLTGLGNLEQPARAINAVALAFVAGAISNVV